VLPGSTASCSNWALRSPNRRSRSTWCPCRSRKLYPAHACLARAVAGLSAGQAIGRLRTAIDAGSARNRYQGLGSARPGVADPFSSLVGEIRQSGMSHVFLQTGHSPQRPDWLAGVVGLELRNVVIKYPFENSHSFPGIQPNSGHRDYSRLSCDVEDTQLRASCRDRARAAQ
jgi:hypothetical protein